MQQLIPITSSTIGEATVQTVNARDLHKFLHVGKDFSSWIKNRIEQFDFTQGIDFTVHPNGGALESSTYGQGKIEYFITLSMAKELSMVERNAKGKEARQYFIECERIAKSPQPLSIEQLLQQNVLMLQDLNQKVITLEKTIELDKPMTDFGKAVSASPTAVLIGDWIKALADDDIKIGRNKAFDWFRENRYLMKNNLPYQQYIKQGLFEIKETLVATPKGQDIRFTTMLTGKGQVFFASKLKQAAK